MHKFYFILRLLLGISAISFAQEHDNVWLMGNQGGSYSPNDTTFGITILRFPEGDIQIENNQQIEMWFNDTDASISDLNGKLLFYFNGIYIEDASYQTMENGGGLNNFNLNGYDLPQGGLYDRRVTALDSISVLDSLLLTATGGAAEQLEADRLAQLDELANLSATNRALVQSIQSDRNAGADGILSQNASINAVDVYEQNEKLVNDLLLRSLAKGIALDGSQIAQLEAIASQCPYTGGPAVFRARGLLADKSEMFFDDGEACNPHGQQLIAPPTVVAGSANARFRLFPNPAAESITLEGLEKVDTDKMLNIFDINSRSVVGIQLNRGQAKATVMIGHLPPGIYMLKVMDGAEELFSEKLIVQ